MEGHVACKGKMENALRILAGKPKRKGPLRRPASTWNENIKMDLRVMGIEGVHGRGCHIHICWIKRNSIEVCGMKTV
jgi:hypothetical protein